MDQYLGNEEEFISGPIALGRKIFDLSGAGGDQWEPIAIASANKKISFSKQIVVYRRIEKVSLILRRQ